MLAVLLAHTDAVPRFDWAGGVGVAVFFTLSGFLITHLLIDERARTGRIELKAFYLRRFRRLTPALVVTLAVWLLIGSALSDDDPSAALWVAGYAANIARVIEVDLGSLRHLWSLSVEEHFYAFWPAVFVACRAVPRRTMVRGLIGAAIVIIGWRAFIWLGDPRSVYYRTDTRLDGLLAGCAIAFAYASGWRPRPSAATVTVCWLGLIALSAATTLMERNLVALTLLPVLTTVVLLSELARPTLTWAPIRYVGRISYGIYLLHLPMIDWFGPAAGAALGVLAAAASWHLVERHFLRSHRPVSPATS